MSARIALGANIKSEKTSKEGRGLVGCRPILVTDERVLHFMDRREEKAWFWRQET